MGRLGVKVALFLPFFSFSPFAAAGDGWLVLTHLRAAQPVHPLHVPVVALIPDDGAFEKMYSNMEEAKARGAKIIAITSTGKEDYFRSSASHQRFVIPIPRTRSFLPVLMTIPLQLLAYEIGVCRGCDVDHPRNLAKSVTVE